MRPLRKPVAANPAHKSEGGRRMAGDGVAPRGSVAPREERDSPAARWKKRRVIDPFLST